MIKIPKDQIQNLQQIESVINGPDGINRMFTVCGQFDVYLSAGGVQNMMQQSETFSVLVGPVFTRKQFASAVCTASISKTSISLQVAPWIGSWQMVAADSDWDDESGQVEIRIQALVQSQGMTNSASINGLAFYCTILAEMQA